MNNKQGNCIDKLFEEKLKEPDWVKRNVTIIPKNYFEDWSSYKLNEISETQNYDNKEFT